MSLIFEKTIAYYKICPFSAIYESTMFYSKSSRGLYP